MNWNESPKGGGRNWPPGGEEEETGAGSLWSVCCGVIWRYLAGRKGHREANRWPHLQHRRPLPSESSSSAPSSRVTGSSCRQMGQELWSLSHGTMQSMWNMWLHGNSLASPPTVNSSMQTGQCVESFFRWFSLIFTVGIFRITESGAGGGPGLSFCVSSLISSSNPGPKK